MNLYVAHEMVTSKACELSTYRLTFFTAVQRFMAARAAELRISLGSIINSEGRTSIGCAECHTSNSNP